MSVPRGIVYLICVDPRVLELFVNTFTNVAANIAQARILQTEFRYCVQLLPVYVSLARVGFLLSREDFNYGREHFSFVVLHCCSIRLLAVEVHLTPWIHQTAILSTRSALGRAADQKLLACSKALKPIIRNQRIITPQDLHLRPLLSPCCCHVPLGRHVRVISRGAFDRLLLHRNKTFSVVDVSWHNCTVNSWSGHDQGRHVRLTQIGRFLVVRLSGLLLSASGLPAMPGCFNF